MKITVIGTGYVGPVSGACLADVGNDVPCLDLDVRRMHLLPDSGNASHCRLRIAVTCEFGRFH